MFKPIAEWGKQLERGMVENDPYAIFVHIGQAAADHPNALTRTQPNFLKEFKQNPYSLSRPDRAMSEVIFGVRL